MTRFEYEEPATWILVVRSSGSQESVDGLLGSSYEFEQRSMAEKGGWSKGVWSKLAEQGLLGAVLRRRRRLGAGAVRP
jgi:hypothetical protein